MLDIPLLKRICETPGAPGFEQRIRQLILLELENVADEIHVDALGNVIAKKNGTQKQKLMLSAHMDEISFIVQHIDEEGFIRFLPLGGFDPKTLTAQRVIIHGMEDVVGVMGCKPIHIMSSDERNKVPQIKDYFIDTGLSKEELEMKVAIGNPITRERELIQMGKCINSKSLDNRISVYVLLEVFKAISSPKSDIYAVFSVQEELGLRGIRTAAHSIQPNFGINIDTTVAFDVPGALPHEMVTRLGNGVAIKIMDSSVVCDTRMVRFLTSLAKQNKITYQSEILPAGGTDTAMVQLSGNGAIAGAISIPTRHIHQVIEMVHEEDVLAAIKLMNIACQQVFDFDWRFQ